MNILILPRCKDVFIQPSTRTVEQYIRQDLLFSSMKDAFEKAGHTIYLEGSDSFVFKAKWAYRFRFLYKVYWKIARKLGFDSIDRRLLSKYLVKKINHWDIDVLFTEVNFNIDPYLIKKGSSKVKITQWFGVSPDLFTEKELNLVNGYDSMFCPVIYDKWLEENGVDSKKFNYMSSGFLNTKNMFHEISKAYAYDVCFVGGLGAIHNNRLEILEYVANEIPSFGFYGYGVDYIPEGYALKNKFNGWVGHEEMRKIFSSSKVAINLGFTGNDKVEAGFNFRVVEIPACKGAVQVCEANKNLAEFYKEGDEIVTFKTKEELVEKIRFLLRNEKERKSIVEASYIRSMEHTYENKIHRILNVFDS